MRLKNRYRVVFSDGYRSMDAETMAVSRRQAVSRASWRLGIPMSMDGAYYDWTVDSVELLDGYEDEFGMST